MSDLTKWVQTRAARDPEFSAELESGYADFKAGALLQQAREKAGVTQEEVAERGLAFGAKSRRALPDQ